MHVIERTKAVTQHLLQNAHLEILKKWKQEVGRSPKEKVKGHSGAIYREPQGHNLNNFGRGPFDDVIYEI